MSSDSTIIFAQMRPRSGVEEVFQATLRINLGKTFRLGTNKTEKSRIISAHHSIKSKEEEDGPAVMMLD